eukprot:3046758-Rhodomonas_salina.4
MAYRGRWKGDTRTIKYLGEHDTAAQCESACLSYTNKKGGVCKSFAWHDSDECILHSVAHGSADVGCDGGRHFVLYCQEEVLDQAVLCHHRRCLGSPSLPLSFASARPDIFPLRLSFLCFFQEPKEMAGVHSGRIGMAASSVVNKVREEARERKRVRIER